MRPAAALEPAAVPSRSAAYLTVLLAYLALAEFCDAFATSFRYQMTTYARADFGVSFPEMTRLLSWVYLGSCLGFVPRAAADVIGRRPVLFLVTVGLCVGQWSVGSAGDATQYAVLLTLLAVFYKADIWVLVMAEEAPAGRRGLFSALPVLVGGAGAITLGELVHRMPATPDAWRAIARFPVWGAVLALPFFLATRETRAFAEGGRMQGGWWTRAAIPFGPRYRRPLFVVTTLKVLFLGGVSVLLGLMGTEFLRVGNGFAPATVGRLIQAQTIGMMLGAFAAGALSDHLGRLRAARLFGLFFAVTLVAMAALPPGSAGVATCYVAQGFFDAGVIWMLRVLSMESFPTSCRGTAAAWTDIVPTLAAIGTAQLLAAVTGMGVSLRAAIVGVAAVVLASLPVFSLLDETRAVDLDRV